MCCAVVNWPWAFFCCNQRPNLLILSDTRCMLLTGRLSPGFVVPLVSKILVWLLSAPVPWTLQGRKAFYSLFLFFVYWLVLLFRDFRAHWPAAAKSYQHLAHVWSQFPHCPDNVAIQRWTETSSCGETSFTQPLQLPVHWLTWAPGRE